jgi:hypothetical protein
MTMTLDTRESLGNAEDAKGAKGAENQSYKGGWGPSWRFSHLPFDELILLFCALCVPSVLRVPKPSAGSLEFTSAQPPGTNILG